MKAFILAAGQGSRLLPLTRNTPKCLIEAGGTTILEYQLATLAACGVREAVIIGGFRVDKIRQRIRGHLARPGVGLRLKIVSNRRYATTNNLYSLWLARGEIDGDFVVLNADNFFHRGALAKVLRRRAQTASLAIRRKPAYDEEDMKVQIAGTRVTRIGKGINTARADAESIGLRAFRGEGVRAFLDGMAAAMVEDARHTTFYVTAIQKMIDAGHRVGYVDVSEYICGELDFPEDLCALEEAMPVLLRGGGRGGGAAMRPGR